METACLRLADIPNTSRLFSDFHYHFDRVQQYYAYPPDDPASYAAAASQIDFPAERRAALVEALRARNGASPALDLLAQPGTVAVVTGQQVGLFSGPAYTLYKALTAARLAQRLTSQGLAAVPIFWLATEDHDLAEINHAFVFDPLHHPVKLTADGSGESQQPVGTIGIGSAQLELMRTTLEQFPFGAEVFALVANAYAPGASFGSAFENLLRPLLAKWGFLFVNPLDEALRVIAAPILRQAIERAPELHPKVVARNKALEAGGYHAQVHVEAQTSFFFVLDGKRRLTLKRYEEDYATKDRRYTTAELAGMAEHLSPNALLRPVIQDYLLPTVAYIGGPAELAYFAQSKVFYDELLGRMPVVLSRAGFTLLDARADKLMTRYSLGMPCFFEGEDCLRGKIARKLIPEALTEEFRTVQASTGEALARLGTNLSAFDPTLAAALNKSTAKIQYQLAKIERKTARETLRRDKRSTEESAYLTGLVYPNRHLQERYYSILPFLARHGMELLDTLYDAVNLECPDHRILVL